MDIQALIRKAMKLKTHLLVYLHSASDWFHTFLRLHRGHIENVYSARKNQQFCEYYLGVRQISFKGH